jgi:D-arabinose 1-dehydrogenase-like Zn-dependent alcohol dehydrogenase
VKLAVDSLIKGGTVIVVGLFGGDITLPTPYIPMRAMALRGSYVGSQTDMAELLDLVKRSGMPSVRSAPAVSMRSMRRSTICAPARWSAGLC